MYSLEPLMMDGKTVRNMYNVIPKQNKLETLIHLVGFTIEIYEDAGPCEPQTCGRVDRMNTHKQIYIQGVPGGKDLTSGECSLGQTIPI